MLILIVEVDVAVVYTWTNKGLFIIIFKSGQQNVKMNRPDILFSSSMKQNFDFNIRNSRNIARSPFLWDILYLLKLYIMYELASVSSSKIHLTHLFSRVYSLNYFISSSVPMRSNLFSWKPLFFSFFFFLLPFYLQPHPKSAWFFLKPWTLVIWRILLYFTCKWYVFINNLFKYYSNWI